MVNSFVLVFKNLCEGVPCMPPGGVTGPPRFSLRHQEVRGHSTSGSWKIFWVATWPSQEASGFFSGGATGCISAGFLTSGGDKATQVACRGRHTHLITKPLFFVAALVSLAIECVRFDQQHAAPPLAHPPNARAAMPRCPSNQIHNHGATCLVCQFQCDLPASRVSTFVGRCSQP